MTKTDQDALLTHETLTIIMLQVLSGAALFGALAQTDALIDLIGYNAFRGLLTEMIFTLLAAVCAAYFKHQYKIWAEVDEQSTEEDLKKRDRKIAVYSWLKRKFVLVSFLALVTGLALLAAALWLNTPVLDSDDDMQATQVMKI